MIKPSVGRVVLFHPHADDGGDINGQPHAATVAHVIDDRTINIAAVNENGSPYARQNVQLVQPGDPVPDHDYACWMDYQLGQAAKTEAAQATAAPALDAVHGKIADLEQGVEGKFQALGDWLTAQFKDFETKIAAANAAPAAAAASTGQNTPPAASAATAAIPQPPVSEAPGAAPAAAEAAPEAQA